MDHHDQDLSRPSQYFEPPEMESKPQATFLIKLYALLERPEYQSMIRWDANGEQIIVERPEQFALHVLPSIYRQSRFASFSQQLNVYGFVRKVNLRDMDPAIDDPDASTWAHPTLTRNSPPEVVANSGPPGLPNQQERSEARTAFSHLNTPPHQALPPHHHHSTSSGITALQNTNHLDSDVSEISLRSTLDELMDLRIPQSQLTIMDSSEVGSGRYGEILVATLDRGSQAPTSVAVKELRTVGTRGVRKRVALRLARELKLWAKANHPHVLRLIGYYLSDNYEIAQLISPFMTNGNVSQYLEKLQVGVLKRLDIIQDITLGLDYLHGCNPPICHGDLKPTNILMNDSLQAVLCDFGLASLVEKSGISTGLTTSRSIKGSIRYMSPEFHLEDEAKHTLESDVWAWACTAFEIVTDCAPYNAAKGDVGILKAIMSEDPPGSTETLMSRLVDETSANAAPAFQNLPDCLTKCWAFEAKQRPRMPSILHQVFPTSGSNMHSLGIERGAVGDDNGGSSLGSGGRAQGRRMTSMGPGGPNRSASLNMGLGLNFPGGKNAPTTFSSLGNFSSTPSRLTSEERLAQSSNSRDRAVSGGSAFMRNAPMSRSSNQRGVGGIGGPNAVPPSPREANKTRSQRGRARNDNLKPDASQLSQQQALSGLEPVPALQEPENRWTPATRSKLFRDKNSPEFAERKVKALLNKLTSENFDSVSNQIINWAHKSKNEKNAATLILVIKLVVEKATDEAHWSEMYARLCRKMMEQISVDVKDDNIRNNAGEPIVGGHLLHKYLLNRCQEDFERVWSQKESAQAAAALKAADDKAAAEAASKGGDGEDNEPVLYLDECHALVKAKRQGQGLVRFLGELFKLQMLTERIMHECIKKLLSKIDDPEEEEIESLCKLLTTVGQALDTPKAKGHMDIYFGRMQMLADNPNVASRIRYMLLDVIELRGRSWRPRNAAAGPSTIAQVREQDARKKAAAAQQAFKMAPMSRTGLQRGGRNAQERGLDGWSVAGPTPVRAVPAKAGDLSNFGKFTPNAGPLKTMGPASVFKKDNRGRATLPPSTSGSISRATSGSNMSNFGKFNPNAGPLKTMGPSSVFKKGDRGRDTPPPSTSQSISRATSGSNMFSLLGAGGAEAVDAMPKRTPSGRGTTRKPSIDQAPQARRKLNLLPRTVSSTNTNKDSTGDEDKPESDEEQANVKTYTDKEAKAKVDEDVKEFFHVRDVSEGEKSFAEMPNEHKGKLVDKLASKALDSKEADVKLVADLFDKVAGKSCPPSAFEEGLAGIIEFLDDTATDVPQAYTFMARMLRGSKLPQETVESLADKIFVDGEPLVKPRDKLLKAYAALA